jgi:acyl-CoA reductase-like NAD-dependent aldehyde dehydrogenase
MQVKSDSGSRPGIQVTAAQLWIDGGWSDPASGEWRDVLDPATGQAVTSAAEAGAQDAARAVQAARTACDDGRWSGMPARERAQVLLRGAALLREHAEELARLESLQAGKPLMFTRAIDTVHAANGLEYYAYLAAGIDGAVRDTAAPTLSYVRREPVGVVAAITPFNFPMILSMTKIAPALAAGNTVVHKPAEETPLTALRVAELLAEAGVPEGVLNVVTGGPEIGDALVRDPQVDKIAFTGSTAVGRSVAAAAAATLKPVTMELGGKGANLVFADADLEAAVGTAVNAFVFNTGQFCMAGSRLLVERPVYSEVLDALAAAVPHVPVGDPFDEGTVVGPMAGPRHRDRVVSYLDRAQAGEAQVVVGGEAAEGPGCFVPPTVLADTAQDSVFVQEEIFGPVLTVQAFDSEEEAVRLANTTPYGLAAGLQTGDVTRAHRVSHALHAGIVWVNGWAMLDPAVPFGGTKQSGYGRENGPEGLDAYLRDKSVTLALG